MGLITCPACGNSVSERAVSCPRCGEPINASDGNVGSPAKDYAYVDFEGKKFRPKKQKPANDDPALVEERLRKWNWGAFGLTWIWGVGNGVYWTLLLLIPGLGWIATPIAAIFLGLKGNSFAWDAPDKEWEDIEHFRHVQRYWAIAAIIVWILVALITVVLIYSISYAIANAGEISIDAGEFIENYFEKRFPWLF